jgi:hypothetical protein
MQSRFHSLEIVETEAGRLQLPLYPACGYSNAAHYLAHCIGGLKNGNDSNLLVSFSPNEQHVHFLSKAFPAHASLLLFTDYLLVLFGKGSSDISVVKLPSHEITTIPSDGPVPRSGACVVKTGYNEFILAFGISFNNITQRDVALRDVWRGVSSASSISWTQLPAAPIALYAPACTMHKDVLYVFGGRDFNGATNTFMFFDRKWSDLKSNDISPRYGASLASIDEELVLFGGVDLDEESAILDNVMYSYIPTHKCWVNQPGCERPRKKMSFDYGREDGHGITWGIIVILVVSGLLFGLVCWKRRKGFESIRRLVSVQSNRAKKRDEVVEPVPVVREVVREEVVEGRARQRTALVLPGTARIGATGVGDGSGVVMRN